MTKLLNFYELIPIYMSILITIIVFLLGIFTGRCTLKSHIIKVTDTFVPKKNRTDEQLRRDAVLQLQNEIAATDAIKYEKDNTISLKIFK